MSDTPRTDKACDYTAPEKLHWLCEELERENARLREAAQDVVDRWETPLWKDAGPTAEVIYRLRDVLGIAPTVSPEE